MRFPAQYIRTESRTQRAGRAGHRLSSTRDVFALSPVSRSSCRVTFGLERRELIEDLLRFVDPAEIVLHSAELVPAVGHIGCSFVLRCSGATASSRRRWPISDNASPYSARSCVGSTFQRPPERRDRRLMVVQVLQQVAAVEVRFGVPGRERNDTVELGQRIALSPQLRVLISDRCQREHVRRIELEHASVEFEREIAPPEQHAPGGDMVEVPTAQTGASSPVQARRDRQSVTRARGGDFEHEPAVSDQQQRECDHRQMAVRDQPWSDPAARFHHGRCHDLEQPVDEVLSAAAAPSAGRGGMSRPVPRAPIAVSQQAAGRDGARRSSIGSRSRQVVAGPGRDKGRRALEERRRKCTEARPRRHREKLAQQSQAARWCGALARPPIRSRRIPAP